MSNDAIYLRHHAINEHVLAPGNTQALVCGPNGWANAGSAIKFHQGRCRSAL